MKELIVKRQKNMDATKAEFVVDLDILFSELKNSYGGYEHFGEERFLLAKENVLNQLENGYSYENAVSVLRDELTAFVYDGHFKVDDVPLLHRNRKRPKDFDYAVHTYEAEGIPVFDIKKFYYETEEEKLQLETFAKSGAIYKHCPYLIFDLRMNGGGSDTYLWEFLVGLIGEEPEPPIDFLQKNSDTFLELLKTEYEITDVEAGIETYQSEGKRIATEQRIYVLIDRHVSSSGESAIANLKTIEGTVVLGENSGGCYFSGNCMDIYLPHTGLCVYYGTGRILYNGTQNIDELGGFAPDIYGEFDVDDVIAMIKESEMK